MTRPIACLFVCSTNGTVINMSKLVKKQTHMLQNGDVIYFVYRKSEPEQSEFFYAMRLCLYDFIRRNDWQYHLSLVTL